MSQILGLSLSFLKSGPSKVKAASLEDPEETLSQARAIELYNTR